MLNLASRARASIALAALCAAACGPPARDRSVVVYASGADLEAANPLVAVHGLTRQLHRNAVFTTLTRYDSALSPVPYLAREWRWSADRTTLTFTVHTDAPWHDGEPATARDVAFTLLAARDPRTGYARSAEFAGVDTVLAPDDSTVVIAFGEAPPAFPLVLCDLPILPAHLLQDTPHGDLRRAAFNSAPIGNGPFRFADRVPGQRWTFTRNEHFPAAMGGPAAIARLVVVVVDEPTTKLAGLSSGELDVAGIAPTMASLAARDPALRVVDYPILLTTGLVFNTHRAPFDDVRVRRAAALAIDRERIVRVALAGYGRAAAGPVPPESPFALTAPPAHDARLSDSLLDAAGWSRGADGVRRRGDATLRAELLTVGSGDNAGEQLVQSDLAARGIAVTIRQMEMGAFLAAARATPKNFDLLMTGIPGDVSLSFVGALFDGRQRGGALDYGDYHTAELDSLFSQARRAHDDERPAAWRAIQEVLARDMPVAWIYHSRGLQGMSHRLGGVTMDLRGELTTLAAWRPDAR